MSQLKRRCDLIANLVQTARGYAEDELETLDAVITARNSAYCAGAKAAANPGHPQAIRELIAAEASLSGALGRFFAMAEAYPRLNADRNLFQISEELSLIENKISLACQAYNGAVMTYNTRREEFPANVVARLFDFAAAKLFQIEDAAEKSALKVSFT